MRYLILLLLLLPSISFACDYKSINASYSFDKLLQFRYELFKLHMRCQAKEKLDYKAEFKKLWVANGSPNQLISKNCPNHKFRSEMDLFKEQISRNALVCDDQLKKSLKIDPLVTNKEIEKYHREILK